MSTRGKDEESRALSHIIPSEAKKGWFGSIRFGSARPRAPPSKFIRIDPNADARRAIDVLLHTWKIPPPCAMLSLAHGGAHNHTLTKEEDDDDAPAGPLDQTMLRQLLRRGIAEAAQKTRA
jgi:hypothetical protein